MVKTPPFDGFADITFQSAGPSNKMSAHPSTYTGDFILDLGEAMRVQLHALLTGLKPVPLTMENITPIDRRPGLYQLFLDDESVYIGKADRDLGRRLLNHFNKLRGRIDSTFSPAEEALIARMKFRCMYIHRDIDSLGPEKLLITAFRRDERTGNTIPWNTNGFGNKDVGRERDSSKLDMLHFDRIYPIDLSLPIETEFLGRRGKVQSVESMQDALEVLKAAFPFTFRYGQTPLNKKQLRQIQVSREEIFCSARTVREWFEWIADQLPQGWVITALSGWVIAYPDDNPYRYHARTNIWWAEGGHHRAEKFEMAPFYKGKGTETIDNSTGEN